MKRNFSRNLLKTLAIAMMYQVSVAQESSQRNLSLQEAFEIAETQNRDLKILSQLSEAAEWAIQQEKDKLLPSLEASLMVSYNGNGWVSDRDFSNGFSIPIPSFGNNFALEAKQLIYAGGAVKQTIHLAENQKKLSELDRKKAQQNIRFGITGLYLEMQKLNNQQLIIEKNIEQTQKMIAQISTKNEMGVALKNNVTRYELQKQSLDVALLKLTNALRILNNELVKLLQLPAGTQLQLQKLSDEEILVLNQANPELYWNEVANENAPELQKASIEIDNIQAQKKLVKSETLPQVFAFASNYLNGPVMIEIPVLDNNFNYWYVGAGIKYDISSLYKNKAKREQVSKYENIALEEELKAKEQLALDIQSASIRFNETLKVYQTQLKNVELANQNYSVVRNRYLNQLSLITEMMDAETMKVDAEMQVENAKINILFQYYQLKKIAGIL